MQLNIASSRRVWLRRAAIAATAVVAAIHVASTGSVVDAYTASNLEPESRQVALALWHFSSIVVVSIPAALLWAARAPAEQARPLQAYSGLLYAGFAAVTFPIAIRENGLAGLVSMPQSVIFLAFAALIAGGMAPRVAGSTSSAAGSIPAQAAPAAR